MIGLPFLAFKLFFTRPRLFALGVFPGVFTFAASCGLVYWIWTLFLQEKPLLFALPIMIVSMLILWLVIGNLALLPVEDAIVDECQRAIWKEVRLPASPFAWTRIGREAFYSCAMGLVALFLLGLTIFPLFAPLEFLLAGWLGSYGFLSTIYARRVDTASGRITLFLGHPVSNFLLGAFLNFLLFVPVLNVFLLGYAQVLAALVYFRREHQI